MSGGRGPGAAAVLVREGVLGRGLAAVGGGGGRGAVVLVRVREGVSGRSPAAYRRRLRAGLPGPAAAVGAGVREGVLGLAGGRRLRLPRAVLSCSLVATVPGVAICEGVLFPCPLLGASAALGAGSLRRAVLLLLLLLGLLLGLPFLGLALRILALLGLALDDALRLGARALLGLALDDALCLGARALLGLALLGLALDCLLPLAVRTRALLSPCLDALLALVARASSLSLAGHRGCPWQLLVLKGAALLRLRLCKQRLLLRPGA
mmetsp:Transcript_102847/g.300038  ORF Transcript_102847/g.300038 Transcript_102847/m.300038 type:complete len:265 (+) Transcript_102847:514-1308(+)